MNPHLLNRRDFMVTAGLLTAGAAIGLQAQPQPANRPDATQEWFDRPMRWMQLVLVENDPGQYEPQWWLDFFQRTHTDGVCLSAGGCVCYYPTKVPFHHKSKWMKDGDDPFGRLVEGCRKQNMVIIARTDSHAILDDAAAAHPEWVAVDAQGNKRRHWSAPDRWVTCAYGPYNFEFMTDVHREIMRMYDVDGIFTNRWSGSGMCYCEACKKLFRDSSGLDLPKALNPQDPAYGKYVQWSDARLFELWRLWDGEIRKIKPRARYIANTGGGSTTSLDMVTISQLAPTLFADRQSRRGVMAPWANGKNGKEFRATFGAKPIVGIASIGIDDDHRWKDSVISEPELRIWLADGVANGLRPWVAKFSGTLYDRRWVPVVEKVYDWQWKNEKYLRNTENLARVAMVYSQQTGTFYGRVDEYENGFYQALIESRVPFEMAHDKLLDAGHIGRYKLLILPNVAALSDAQCQQIRQYVQRGGSLIATYETSLCDETGKRRPNFGLADLFGASYAGNTEAFVKNSYMRIEAETKHPILRGLEDAGRIINTVRRANVKTTDPFPNPPLTQIPSYPDLPMEDVFPRVPKTDIPEVYLRQVGRGRVVYFPGDIDRTFWEILAVDHLKLLGNSIEWALDESNPVTVTGPGVVDTTIWRQAASMTVHMVNLTNPMMLKAPYRELIPLPPQQVKIKVPSGSIPRGVKLLVSNQTPQFQVAAGVLSLTVPSVLDHEVIAIDFQS